MSYLDIIKKIEQGAGDTATGTERDRPDSSGPILAVKVGGSVIGDYWLVLDETEPFAPGDGLPVYRPSEIRALKGKGYGPEALQAVHQTKVILEGKIVQ